MPPDAEALKALFATNRHWSELAAIAVFVGLLGDILVIFLFSKDKPKSETWLAFLCTLVIAGGVYGEYTFGGKASQLADQLQQISDGKVADLNKEAGDARQEAGKANERASNNEKEAKRLGKLAADEQLARTRLQEQIQPREFIAAEEVRILEACRPFVGDPVDVRSQPYDVEGAVFATSLADVLKKTKLRLRTVDIGNPFMQNLPMTFDVHIAGPPNEQALVRALAESIATPRVIVAPLGPPTRVGSITSIIVGAKRLAPKAP